MITGSPDRLVSPSKKSLRVSDLDRLGCDVLCGNALTVIHQLKIDRPDLLVNCVTTSPPYFNKREYGKSDQEIGREGSVDVYCRHLVSVFNAIPLHPLGSIWVNIGDKRSPDGGLLCVPHWFCQMMLESGWKLIDEVSWAKVLVDDDGQTEGGYMTEPAPGRLNGNGFEVLYRFVKPPKGQKGWTDTCAVRIPRLGGENIPYLPGSLMKTVTAIDGRSLSNSWRVQMGQTTDRHFAVFAPTLVERPIAMTCPMWVNPDESLVTRIVEMVPYDEQRGGLRKVGKYNSIKDEADVRSSGRQDSGRVYVPRKPRTIGWSPKHPDWKPGITLDPFCGTGTAGEVALRLGRSFIGIDLYEENCRLTRDRCNAALDYLRKNNLNPFLLAR